jgi:hypothetical protein
MSARMLLSSSDFMPIYRMSFRSTQILCLCLVTVTWSLGGCSSNNSGKNTGITDEQLASPNSPVAIVRTTTLQWEGEQTYVPLFEDGSASGLVVVNFDNGKLYGTGIPVSWSWASRDTVEICISVNILRNEAGFPPMERDCAPHPITGKELDLDDDGDIDLIETFTILDQAFYADQPDD